MIYVCKLYGIARIKKINYNDNSSRKIEYEAKSGFVNKITSRDGSLTKYKYGSDPKNKDLHFWTQVINEGNDGSSTSNRYEYELKRKKDGAIYTYKVSTIENGLKTETLYNECCSLPTRIEKVIVGRKLASLPSNDENKEITTFKYNDRGLLIEKESSNGKFVKLDYHNKFNKITKVKANSGVTKFKYDKSGNIRK